jgi:hypothetical protein
MIGGLLICFIMELLLYPVVFYLYKRWQHGHDWKQSGPPMAPPDIGPSGTPGSLAPVAAG